MVGATWLTAGGYLSFLLSFVGNLLLVRLLFPQDFGTFALVSSLVELLSILGGLAVSQGIIQMPEAPDVEDTAYRMTLRLCLALLGVGTVAAGIAGALRDARFGLLVLVVFGIRLVNILSYVYTAQLERAFRYRSLSGVRLLSALAGLGAGLTLAVSGAGVWSLVGREIAGVAVTFAAVRAITPWRYRGRYDAATAGRLRGFGVRVFATRSLEVINYRADAVLLGLLAGTVPLGFYDRARFLAELGHYAVSFAAVQVAFPLYARFGSEPERLGSAYRIIHYFLIRIMLPAAFTMIVLPEALVGVVLGSRWEQSVAALRWLAPFAFLLPVLDNAKVLLTGIGHLNDALRIRVAQVVVTISGLAVLTPRWGGPGAAAALTLGSLAGAVVAYAVLRRLLSDLALRMYLVPLIAAALAVLVGLVSRRTWLLPWPAPWNHGAVLGTTAAAYLLILVMLEYPELRRNLHIIWPRRHRRVEEAL